MSKLWRDNLIDSAAPDYRVAAVMEDGNDNNPMVIHEEEHLVFEFANFGPPDLRAEDDRKGVWALCDGGNRFPYE